MTKRILQNLLELTLCMLSSLDSFLSSADLFNVNFFIKKTTSEYHQSSAGFFTLAAGIADLAPYLQVFLSWGCHLRQSFSINTCIFLVILGFPSSYISHAVLTAPLECSTHPNPAAKPSVSQNEVNALKHSVKLFGFREAPLTFCWDWSGSEQSA